MKKSEYREYLQSEAWQIRRRWKLHEAGYRCQVCNSGGEVHVHHRTYERIGEELPYDLTVLCANCHGMFHRKVGEPTDEYLEVITAWRQAVREHYDESELFSTLISSPIEYNPRTGNLLVAMSPTEVDLFIENKDGLRSKIIQRARELAVGYEWQVVPVIAPYIPPDTHGYTEGRQP